MTTLDRFRLDGRAAVITGGAGFMGLRHAEVVAEAGGTPILWDVDADGLGQAAEGLQRSRAATVHTDVVDITDPAAVHAGLSRALDAVDRIAILINNAANDPKADGTIRPEASRFEQFSLESWHKDLGVGLTGAFLCSQLVGNHMVAAGGGVILNIASDLALISPDQRLYEVSGQPADRQPVKPVTYSVAKHGLIGLTRYLATYWAAARIRVNAISPGGIYRRQPDEFVERLSQLIPLGRMAHEDEYKAAVLFLVSDASSYMTGANLVVDGGRTCW